MADENNKNRELGINDDENMDDNTDMNKATHGSDNKDTTDFDTDDVEEESM